MVWFNLLSQYFCRTRAHASDPQMQENVFQWVKLFLKKVAGLELELHNYKLFI